MILTHPKPSPYYYMPQIYDAYHEEYHHEIPEKLRTPSDWRDFITRKNLGIHAYLHPQANMLWDRSSVVTDYYRVTCARRFLITALRLGIDITRDTPRIARAETSELSWHNWQEPENTEHVRDRDHKHIMP